jgi:hypothetical protein
MRKIIEARLFSKALDALLKRKQLIKNDYDDLKKELVINPERGDLIPGTGGVRKIRMKSASKGKRGGFRACYYYLVQDEEIYLLLLYAKNEQENLTMDEKKDLKLFIHELRGAKK